MEEMNNVFGEEPIEDVEIYTMEPTTHQSTAATLAIAGLITGAIAGAAVATKRVLIPWFKEKKAEHNDVKQFKKDRKERLKVQAEIPAPTEPEVVEPTEPEEEA